jgi:TolB-like protein
MPFHNLTGNVEDDYFVDGMVEEVVTGLSRIKWLFVISRNSTLIYKGKPIDVRTVGRELGVRYVLEGSVRRSGSQMRLTGQLSETESGASFWADRYDGDMGEVFALQDLLTVRVIGAVEPNLRKAEIERARRKRPENLDAYDLFLRALPFAATAMPENADKALCLLEEAIRLEPDYAVVHGFIAWCHEQRYLRGGLHAENASSSTAPCAGCDRDGRRRCHGIGNGRLRNRRRSAGLQHGARRARSFAFAQSIVGARIRIQLDHSSLDGR